MMRLVFYFFLFSSIALGYAASPVATRGTAHVQSAAALLSNVLRRGVSQRRAVALERPAMRRAIDLLLFGNQALRKRKEKVFFKALKMNEKM